MEEEKGENWKEGGGELSAKSGPLYSQWCLVSHCSLCHNYRHICYLVKKRGGGDVGGQGEL